MMDPRMDLIASRELAHAQAVRSRGNAMPPDGLPDAEILDSWVRSNESGLRAEAPLRIEVVPAPELAQRREAAAAVRRLAQAELETLAQQIAGSNYLLAFADQDGVILDLFADNRFSMSGSGAGIKPGGLWSEAQAGTNGLGTALACGQSVAVTGLEHFFLELGSISCTATPVRDAYGRTVGVLDASSYVESRQRHTQALVQMAATHIESGLMLQQMRSQLVLAVHPRPEYLGTLSAGLLAFDEQGALLALNTRGRQILHGLPAAPGTAFETLFGEDFGVLLARLQRHGEVALRDTLGSAVFATALTRPRALSQTPALPLQPHQPHQPRPHQPYQPGQPQSLLREAAPRRQPAAAAGPAAPEAVADDPAAAAAHEQVRAAVRLRVPVLILGETGTGKELLARHAHACSGRSGAFVAVNCGALPAELFEAELFGYRGGAFSGARREGSDGLIVSADGGTLLLDEVCELPLPLQAALLRFLDDQQVRPVGGVQARRVDVQLLAATNAEIEGEVAAGRFRADLFYRLNTVRVQLPPLRQRQDLPAAARRVLAAVDASRDLDEAAIRQLASHGWPGNFRELRAVLTRAVLGTDSRCLREADVARHLPPIAPSAASGSALQQTATALVRRELDAAGGSVSAVARRLGISRTTVYRHRRGGG